jgi:hypothetical protein
MYTMMVTASMIGAQIIAGPLFLLGGYWIPP